MKNVKLLLEGPFVRIKCVHFPVSYWRIQYNTEMLSGKLVLAVFDVLMIQGKVLTFFHKIHDTLGRPVSQALWRNNKTPILKQ